ncbi:DUF298-domain-containing protein [Diplogelasinospora grovesii]|uniref:Defective in cullin neddylation protein n=1 Tax=Diplogelasinospora grovesii TaxID=303347 RepID=A0AAN6S1S6_9PEZI|nr:DUF298-domain-containing protein [Diplogelasinospora grovesii]
MPSTTTQRKLVSQFVAVTNATKENAQRYLKNANFDLDTAVNLYFNSSGPVDEQTNEKLGQMFDGLVTDEDRQADPQGNSIGAQSMEDYMKLLGIDMTGYEFFVALDIVQANSFAQITRSGFVEGWKESGVQPDMSAHKRHVRGCIDRLPKDPAYFKAVYRRAFLVGKEAPQKALEKETALVFWDMLLGSKVYRWQTKNVNWLETWKSYLEEKWGRGVNKDMWNQTLEFANRTLEDETLGFWSEDGAWPGVIDDFVLWCREHGIGGSKSTDGMEVDY